MGLTLHYGLKSAARTPSDARALVARLRSRALDLPFADVGELAELTSASEMHDLDRENPLRWLVCQAAHYVEHGGYHFDITPSHLIAFVTMPGDGSEPANFGLCRYPTTTVVELEKGQRRRIKTGVKADEWTWSSFCKTQYASDPKCGGVQNFLKCHLLVTAILDRAKSLGILEEVSDEGGFWEHRDAEALAKEVGGWNAMIAGVAGQLKDLMGDQLVAPITQYPTFEHLEAEGRAGE